MKILHAICVVSLLICVVQFIDQTEAGAIDVWTKCDSNANCTVEHTICDILGCIGRVCQCPRNMTMDATGNTCKITKKLGEGCNDATDRCVFLGSICRNNICECEKLMKQDTAHDCIPVATKNKIFGDIVYQPYGAMCDGTNKCAYFDHVCSNTKCNCTDGFRPATFDEINAHPNSDARCRQEGYMAHEWSLTLCKQTNLKIGEQCGVDDMYKCPDNASCVSKDCNTKMCVCDEGFITDSGLTMCVKPKHYGEACTVNGQCVDYGNECIFSTCKCHLIYTDIGGVCQFKAWNLTFAHHGQNCTSRTDLQNYVFCIAGTTCVSPNNVCDCPTDRVFLTAAHKRYKPHVSHLQCAYERKWWLTDEEYTAQCSVTTTPEIPLVGRNCTNDNICPSNSECIMYSCSMRCVCLVGYTAASDLTQCVNASIQGEACTENDNCAFKNGECVSNKCQCDAFSTLTSDGQCSKNGQLPTGSACTTNDQCYGNVFGGQMCTMNKCQCDESTKRPMSALELRNLRIDKSDYRCEDKNKPLAEASCDPSATTTTPTTTMPPTTTTTTTTTPTTTTTTPTTTPPRVMVKIDETCDAWRYCPGNATCEAHATGEMTCRCDAAYIAKTDKTGCNDVRFFGDSCDATSTCVGSDASCINNICTCDNTGFPADKFYCLSGHQPYLEFSATQNKEDGTGSTRQCGTFGAVSKMCLLNSHLDCTSGFCVCATNYRDALDADRLASPSQKTYCVNASWPAGYRPLRGSAEALVQDEISLEDFIKNFEKEMAENERKENAETSKLIIAACISAVGLFAIIVFIAIVARKVIRKRRPKNIRSDKFDSS